MKIYRLIPLLFFVIVSCANFSVKNEISDLSTIKPAKKLGIIVRSTLRSRVSREEVISGLSKALNGFKHEKELSFLADLSPQLVDFTVEDERFYQTENDTDFLRYKSIGVIKSYLQTNRNEISKAVEKNSLDGIIIFEEYAIISLEMQLMRMNSVMVIADKEGNITYLDHQDNLINSEQTDIPALKKEMVGKLTSRFLEKMLEFKFIKNL